MERELTTREGLVLSEGSFLIQTPNGNGQVAMQLSSSFASEIR
jgi:hypothetical protein